MALSPAQLAVLARLNSYNGSPYNVTSNPLGFARGGNVAGVYTQALADVAYVGQLAADLAAMAQQAASDTAAAAILIQGGPVSSVAGIAGNVTAAALKAALNLGANTAADVAALQSADLTERQIALALAYTGAR